MADLSTDVRTIKGIGEQRAKSLEKLGIRTLRDLISWFPRRTRTGRSSAPSRSCRRTRPGAGDSPICSLMNSRTSTRSSTA